MKTLIINARIVDSKSDWQGAILCEAGRIKELIPLSLQHEHALRVNEIRACLDERKDQVIDAKGKLVMPAFIDTHAHFRDPGFLEKEDILTGSLAAIHGGYSYVNLMANTKPVCDNIAIWNTIINKARSVAKCGINQAVALTKELAGQELVNIAELGNKIKILSDDGQDRISNNLFYQACLLAKQYDKTIMVHPQDPSFSLENYEIAEEIATLRSIYFSQKTGCKIHISHVSTAMAVQLIKQAKQTGVNITAEVTPHHLALSDLDYRVNPPIRHNKDVKSLINAIKEGVIDVIGTDHAPHTEKDKLNGAPGLVGLETAFAVCHTALVRPKHISYQKLSALMSEQPAKLLRLNKRGLIEVGYYADLVLIDPKALITVDPAKFHSKSKNTPFAGKKYFGKILKTIVNGKVVAENDY